jgi:DNA-directed RNA polymerase specialized sigma24 family protein
MEDRQLYSFLDGDMDVIERLCPEVVDMVVKAGGSSDDAKEVFQIVSLTLFEQHRRSLSQCVAKECRAYLNKLNGTNAATTAGIEKLEAWLQNEFESRPDLKTRLKEDRREDVIFFSETVSKAFVRCFPGRHWIDEAAERITSQTLQKVQRRILNFRDYFFKSCKYEWIRLKKKRNLISLEEETTHLFIAEEPDDQPSEQTNLILNLLKKASGICRKLLHMVFVEGKPKEELWPTLGYTNSGSFDVAKSRCLSALRQEVKQNILPGIKNVVQP